MFPEQLYLPTAYDYATGIAPRRVVFGLHGGFTGSSAGGVVFTNEPNRVLLIKHVTFSMGAQAVGTEVIFQVEIAVLSGNNTVHRLLFAEDFSAAGLGRNFNRAFETTYLLMPDERINVISTKSAAVETFRHSFTGLGFVLPRANIQSG